MKELFYIVNKETGCWEWQGSRTHGYGRVYHQGRTVATHRLFWELAHGSIPEGMQVDHLCRNRACCNPAHMEIVTQRENILRGEAPTAQNAHKTHCKRGHEFTDENTIHQANGRSCRECQRQHHRNWLAKRTEAAA